MNGKVSTAFRWGHAVLILVIVVCGCFVFVPQAKAVLTAQSISGTVEVFLAGEQDWKPLTATMKLKTGDQIRTGPSSSVDLWFEDGSVLNLAEGTQLSINQLEVSPVQKSRIARFKLWWGAVTAKVTKLAFTENVCEVETETVVAGVKFSEMTVIQPQNTSQSEVVVRQGLIEIRQIGEGMVNFSAFLSPKGLTGQLLKVGDWVTIDDQKILQQIVLKGRGVRNLRAVFDGDTIGMKINNNSDTPVDVGVQNLVATLGAQSSALFTKVSDMEMFITGDTLDLECSPKSLPAFKCSGLGTIKHKGELFVKNKEDLSGKGENIDDVGVPHCFPLEGLKTGRGIGPGILREGPISTEAESAEEQRPPSEIESGRARGADPEEEEEEVEPSPTPEGEEVEEWDEQDWLEWEEEQRERERQEQEEASRRDIPAGGQPAPPSQTPASP